MLSNLPPGVTEGMLPGNRPEDQEVELTLIFTVGEIEDLRDYYDDQMKESHENRSSIWYVIENMLEQLGGTNA